MSMADEMTASILRAQAETAVRKKLGRWPVDDGVMAARMEAAKMAGMNRKRNALLSETTFGGRLARARIALNLPQGAVGKAAGVSQPNVAQWEKGICVARPKTMAKLARVLGVTVEWLMEGDK